MRAGSAADNDDAEEPARRHSGVVPAPAKSVEELFREHGSFVWRTLRRFGLSECDCDDQCQEVFLVVFRRLSEFEHRSSFTTWLYGIAVRVALAHRRRASVKREQPTESPPDVPTSQRPDEQVAKLEASALLDRALDQLDDDKRVVFVLFEIEQLPMTEVARAVECPLQTAYSRLHAARDHVESYVKRASRGRWAG